VATLRRSLSTARLAHAYLLCGPGGVGKATIARAIAKALACDVSPRQGCDQCNGCRRVGEGLHPDLLVLATEGPSDTIKVEAVRSLIGRLSVPPHEAPARVVLIDGIDRITEQAGNALLKTLEEPPASTYFFLVTEAPERTLLTLRSRCQRVAFGALTAEAIERLLRRLGPRHDPSADAEEQFRRIAHLAEGSAARALELARDDSAVEARLNLLRDALAAVGDKHVAPLAASAVRAAADRDALGRLLDDLLVLLHRALRGTAPLDTDHALQRALAPHHGTSPQGLLGRWQALREVQAGHVGNANATLTAERALMALRHPAPWSFRHGR
jgi:DNA polymerase-3 subunit delta'